MIDHKTNKKDKTNIILLMLIATLSSFQSIFFYFWHDDYSVLHCAQTGYCTFTWPYLSYTYLFPILNNLFNYNSYLFFGLGFFLFLFSVVCVYILLRQFYKSDVALYSSSIYAALLIAQGVFQEAYSSITSFLSIGFICLTITFLKIALDKKKIKYLHLFFAYIFFVLSISVLRARSITYFIPVIAVIILFSKSLSLLKKIGLSIFSFLFYYYFYFLYPVNATKGFSSKSGEISVEILFQKLAYFFEVLGSILYSDVIAPIVSFKIYYHKYYQYQFILFVLGILLILIIFYLFFNLNKINKKNYLFGLMLMFSFYFPYGWVAGDWRLLSTHRYLIFLLVALVFIWSSLNNLHKWKKISIFFVVIGLVTSNIFMFQHLKKVKNQRSFYQQMHSYMDTFEEGTYIFVDYSKKEQEIVSDFFRVGATPPVSAIGTEFGVSYEKLYLIEDSQEIIRLIDQNKLNINNFESFYYKDSKLTYTKQILENYKNEEFNLKNKITNTEEIYVNNFLPIFPYVLSADILVSLDKENLNQIKNKLQISFEDFVKYTEYLNLRYKIENNVSVFSSSENYGQLANFVIDEDDTTRWSPHVAEWLDPQKESYLHFDFAENVKLSGIELLDKGSFKYSPQEFKLYINEKLIDFQIEHTRYSRKILFDETTVKSLRIAFLSTPENDVPSVYEIKFFPGSYSDVDSQLVDYFADNILDYVSDKKYSSVLNNYLYKGFKACIEWKTLDGETGRKNIVLYADSVVRNYDVVLPAKGASVIKFNIGCLNEPVNLQMFNVNINLYKIFNK